MIYGYNIIRFKNHRLTKKMVFFSFILFPAIVDNIYDYVTGGDVSKFDTESIVALLIIMIVFALISILMCVLILIMDLWSINLKGVVGHKKSRAGANKIFLYFLKY